VSAAAFALAQLRGAFALAMIFRGHDDLMIVARQGSPLAIGYGDGEMFVGSDAIALAPFTDQVAYLEDGDWAVITREGVAVRDRAGARVVRPVARSLAAGLIVDKGNYRHFMAKEIHEQPDVVSRTLGHYLDLASYRVALPKLPFDFSDVNRLSLSACGTAFYACFVAKYWFERWAKLPVDVDIASEF
ncbi:MAG: glutamine--fructose-6-phosphate aminotransferase, partial [Planctomycetes bacterium]|nr:glutamine--fructose-6-phosphate aminotransferase [Planctomycetota bacterium]